MARRILLWPDTHVPAHDKRIIRSLINFVKDYQPDEIVHIGDLMDYNAPSRWSKDTAAEFQTSVFEENEVCKAEFLTPLREAYHGPIGVIAGNHDSRPSAYLKKYAPALAESKAFDLDVMLEFDKYQISLLPAFYDVAPGWVATHGHQGGIRLAQTAGLTALGAARKLNKSVVMGHTHRLAALSHTSGYPGNEATISGVEIGHVTVPALMEYTKGQTHNWQLGFGVMKVDGTFVTVDRVEIKQSKFSVDGVVYTIK